MDECMSCPVSQTVSCVHQRLLTTFPSHSPLCFTCTSVLGCKVCGDMWYWGKEGSSKKCPLCCVDGVLPETMQLHGLDDFLPCIQPIIAEPNDTKLMQLLCETLQHSKSAFISLFAAVMRTCETDLQFNSCWNLQPPHHFHLYFSLPTS